MSRDKAGPPTPTPSLAASDNRSLCGVKSSRPDQPGREGGSGAGVIKGLRLLPSGPAESSAMSSPTGEWMGEETDLDLLFLLLFFFF